MSNTYEGITFKDILKLVIALQGSAMLSFTLMFMLMAHNPGHPYFNLIFSGTIGALLTLDSQMDNINRGAEEGKRQRDNEASLIATQPR